jgi:hypothetical protein
LAPASSLAIGWTQKATNAKLDECKGKVLVIDEAYALMPQKGYGISFGKEALDVLVERVQGTPGEDCCVIMCGYEHQMKEMITSGNPGLARRFQLESAFRFSDYSDAELANIMVSMAAKQGLSVSQQVAASAVAHILKPQRSKPNFGNAGAVRNLLDAGKQECLRAAGSRPLHRDARGSIVLLEEHFLAAPGSGRA